MLLSPGDICQLSVPGPPPALTIAGRLRGARTLSPRVAPAGAQGHWGAALPFLTQGQQEETRLSPWPSLGSHPLHRAPNKAAGAALEPNARSALALPVPRGPVCVLRGVRGFQGER